MGLTVGQVELRHDESRIILQKTALGWIVAGGTNSLKGSSNSICNVIKLDKLIESFWIIGDFDHELVRSRDEITCEEYYRTHTKRDASGRYIVRLPFRDSKFHLGESKRQALKRFYALERKFEADPSLKATYSKAMNEYISLGHMTPCDDVDEGCFLPHHPVIKECSETTKVRPVFDASSKTSTGISLNDVLMVGPTIQNTIFEQVLRFQMHRFVITADIEKMYRQILVHLEDRKYLKIWWYVDGKVAQFQLNTLTFGTACAPFLAIRTIQQLARDEAKDFSRASKLLQRDFYVDDFISGADSIDEILSIRDEMIKLLSRGGFIIRQWASNHSAVLDNIDRKIFDLDCGIRERPMKKTLGIIWNSRDDILTYIVGSIDPQNISTKRKLLSEISKIYDPLGLLEPVILYAKVLIQDCWKSKISWDESLPQVIQSKWQALAKQLPTLQDLVTSRRLLGDSPIEIEFHGFCDACAYGYGACLFLKSIDAKGLVTIKLACSKSRVAPISGVTIPRLELCAASVLKRLYVKARVQFDFPIKRVIFWTAFTIVLCWLRKAPHLLRTFDVRSEDNPADALSRGQLPSEFIKNTLWAAGPSWLVFPEAEWPRAIESSLTNIPGLKKDTCLLFTIDCASIYSRFSSFQRFIRVVAFMLHWRAPNTNKKPSKSFSEISEPGLRLTKIVARESPLLCHELVVAERKILAMVQRQRFSKEIKLLATARDTNLGEFTVPFHKATGLDELNPFLDEHNLIREGGRLKRADLIYNQLHPLLLPSQHPVTDSIIREIHETNLHADIQSTLYSIRERFWVLNGKNQVRRIVHHCVECIRQRPKIMHAQMADLPETRITEAPAFSRTGVDIFGPILTKEKKDRNRSFLKTYGCVLSAWYPKRSISN